MPRLRPKSPLGVALTAFELWRRLPPKQRQRVLRATRKHGPRLAAAILTRRRPR
jgi:acyl-CoA reductase-like NAD-dependent aldehyde dehydrogenase